MVRLFVGFAICAMLGAGVAFSGVGRLLPLDAVVPPPVPDRWAAPPTEGRVDLILVRSDGFVGGLAAGLSRAEVALHRGGAIALVDGRVFAISAASARSVLRELAWDRLPIDARQLDAPFLYRFAAPHPAPLAWRLRRDAYLGLRATREFVAAHPSFAVTSVAVALLLLLRVPLSSRPWRKWSARELETPVSPWRQRRAERPVRVVLVPDAHTLAQLRMAIGEEHVVAATEHAFAFAGGWILAARKGSVFELVSELGWRMRPIELATRAELVGEGHALSPLPGDDGGDTLGLLEALHVCGPPIGPPRPISTGDLP